MSDTVTAAAAAIPVVPEKKAKRPRRDAITSYVRRVHAGHNHHDVHYSRSTGLIYEDMYAQSVDRICSCAKRAMQHAKRSKMSDEDVAFALREILPMPMAETAILAGRRAVDKLKVKKAT